MSRETVAALLAAVQLLELHGPTGQRAYVNVNEISTLREPNTPDLQRYFMRGVHCVVVTTNGQFLAVTETCDDIRNQVVGRPP